MKGFCKNCKKEREFKFVGGFMELKKFKCNTCGKDQIGEENLK